MQIPAGSPDSISKSKKTFKQLFEGFFAFCGVLKKVDQNLKKMVNTKSKKRQCSPRSYSVNFKQLVVQEYESGSLNKDQLQRKYDIRGNDCIQSWLRKYGKLVYPKHTSIGRPMKNQEQQRITELEAELELSAYKKFVEIAERNLTLKSEKSLAPGSPGNSTLI